MGAPGCRLDPLSQPRLVLQQMGREVGQVAAGHVHFKHAATVHKVSHGAVLLRGCLCEEEEGGDGEHDRSPPRRPR